MTSNMLTPYTFAATASYIILVTGILNRKKRNLHASLMTAAISLDILIVIILEVSKNVVNIAATEPMTVWLLGHITASSIAVLLYIPVLILGGQMIKKPQTARIYRSWHLRFGVSAFAFRSIGIVLMYTMLYLKS